MSKVASKKKNKSKGKSKTKVKTDTKGKDKPKATKTAKKAKKLDIKALESKEEIKQDYVVDIENEDNTKKREIITINIGGCGVNMGDMLMQQYCKEHNVSYYSGKSLNKQYNPKSSGIFEETMNGTYIGRTINIDTDPYGINYIKNVGGKVYNSRNLISSKTDSHKVYSVGYDTNIDSVNNAIRKEVESCDNIQGFNINHSYSGGTGSGFGAKILERINVDYRRKPIYSFGVLCDVDQIGFQYYNAVYNQLLIMAKLLDFTKMTYLFDNIQMKNIFTSNQISGLNYNGYNTLITKAISSITQLMRFGGYSMQRLIDEMILFPRINQILTGISPIISINNNNKLFKNDYKTNIKRCCKSDYFSIRLFGFDYEEDKYTSSMFLCRGNKTSNISDFISSNKFDLKLVEFSKQKNKLYVNANIIPSLKSDNIVTSNKQVTMIGNNTCIARYIENQLMMPFKRFYKHRVGIWNYIGGYVEESEFAESLENFAFNVKDYKDLLSY